MNQIAVMIIIFIITGVCFVGTIGEKDSLKAVSYTFVVAIGMILMFASAFLV